jgi:hypothetical protein
LLVAVEVRRVIRKAAVAVLVDTALQRILPLLLVQLTQLQLVQVVRARTDSQATIRFFLPLHQLLVEVQVLLLVALTAKLAAAVEVVLEKMQVLEQAALQHLDKVTLVVLVRKEFHTQAAVAVVLAVLVQTLVLALVVLAVLVQTQTVVGQQQPQQV